MTQYARTQAQELADKLVRVTSSAMRDDAAYLLRDIADHVDALTAERDALANAAKSVTQRFDALKLSDPARTAKLNINALRFALDDMKEPK